MRSGLDARAWLRVPHRPRKHRRLRSLCLQIWVDTVQIPTPKIHRPRTQHMPTSMETATTSGSMDPRHPSAESQTTDTHDAPADENSHEANTESEPHADATNEAMSVRPWTSPPMVSVTKPKTMRPPLAQRRTMKSRQLRIRWIAGAMSVIRRPPTNRRGPPKHRYQQCQLALATVRFVGKSLSLHSTMASSRRGGPLGLVGFIQSTSTVTVGPI